MSGKPARPAPRRPAPLRGASASPAAPAPGPNADLRVIVEETGEAGRHVYTLLDRRTGKVVGRFGEREMLERLERGRYAAGDGLDVKA